MLEIRVRAKEFAMCCERRAVGLRLLQLVAVALIIAPVIYWQGGILDPESTWFITNYLDNRGIAQKIFDPNKNDFNTYQGRELSHAFDFLNAQVFRVLLGRGYLLFIACSSLLASAALLLVHQLVTARLLPSLNRVTSILVLLLYLSGFVHLSTDGTMYRSAKPLLVPLVLLGMTLLWHFHRTPRDEPWSRARSMWVFLLFFGLGSAMSLLDRMGFFLVIVAAAIVDLHWLLGRGRLAVFFGLAAAGVFGEFYNRVLGPVIIQAVNGYSPAFEFQQFAATRVFARPESLVQGAHMLLEQAWFFFGSYTMLLSIAAVSVFLVSHIRRARPVRDAAWSAVRLPLIYALFVSLALVLMLALLLARHPILYDIDHRLTYYGVPIQAMLILPTMLCLDWFLAGASARRVFVVNAILLCLVVGNIAGWNGYKRQMLSAAWFSISYEQTAALRRSLAQGRRDPQLAGPYVSFFDLCKLRDGQTQGDDLPRLNDKELLQRFHDEVDPLLQNRLRERVGDNK